MDEIMGTLFKYLVRLLGVAVVVIILVAIFHKSKGASEVANLSTLTSNISQTYTGQPTFTGLTTAIAAELAPTTMVNGATMVNAWGGAVTATPDTNNTEFDIVENAVPSEGCVDLVTKATNYVSITLNGTSYPSTTPIDAGVATTQCNAAATQVITFVYGH